ncbi:MAG: acetolactate synthase small subunit [Acidobacteria bacterium]|nr:acetolactate synthase small subunit [Acidobacteriota bacterium]
MGKILSLLVENKAGVLSRVVGLFSQRGYNIGSLNVAPTQDPTMSRITLEMETDERGTEQVVKQLNKLIDVIKVTPFNPSQHLAREMALIGVRVKEENRNEVLAISKVFRARVVDASPQSYTFEVTGQSEKIDAFISNVRVYGIREVHRTGKLAASRGTVRESKRLSQRDSREQPDPHSLSRLPEDKPSTNNASVMEAKRSHG